MSGLRWRFFWPMTLISLCLVMLCVFTAVSLFHQQSTVAGILRENVASRRTAVETEECLTDLVALEQEKVETVAVLHARVRTHLETMRKLCDEPEEKELYDRIAAGFDQYLLLWQAMPPFPDPSHGTAFREATRFLEVHVLKPCTELRLYQGRRLEDVTEHH